MSKRVWIGIAGSWAVVAAMLFTGWALSRSAAAPWWLVGRTRELSLALTPVQLSPVTGRLPLPSTEESRAASALAIPATRKPAVLRPFDIGAAMSSIREITAFGSRGAGSPAETRAADYL